jgi:lathosterol oxidase
MSINATDRTLRRRPELLALAATAVLGLAATAAVLSDWTSPSQAGNDCLWAALGREFAIQWPSIFAFDLGRYAIAAVVMAGIVALLLRWGRWRKRIQARPPRGSDYGREVAFSVQTALIFSLVGFCVYLGLQAGLFAIDGAIAPRGWGYFVLSLAGMILAHDAYFYWTHRAMHHPRLFRFFHLMHHRSTTPSPFAAYAFAWPEALVQALFMPLWLLFVPMQAAALLAFMAVMIVRNVMGHAGMELHPPAFVTSRWLGWLSTTTHHDLHHQRFAGNYGLYFTWWDKLMGTEVSDYRERFLQATEATER